MRAISGNTITSNMAPIGSHDDEAVGVPGQVGRNSVCKALSRIGCDGGHNINIS